MSSRKKKMAWFSPGIDENDGINDGRKVLGECELQLTMNDDEARELALSIVRQLSSAEPNSIVTRVLVLLPELLSLSAGEDVVQVVLPRGLLEMS